MKPHIAAVASRAAALLLLCFVTFSSAFAANWASFPGAAKVSQESIHEDHPFVALAPEVFRRHKVDVARKAAAVELIAAAAVSPTPNQLRIQDLRGVECYPQPDNLEVCGAPDTTCILLFTKSEERLPEIELTIRFGEGIEYGGFAEIDYSDDAVFPPPLTDLDVISDQNPEAPSFLVSGVTRDSGAVYVCFGIRAECGVDIDENPPFIEYDWRYTTASGVFCEDSFMPPVPFSGNIITPRAAFNAPFPGNLNLNGFNETNRCQTINITQLTPGASLTGYQFTASNYGFPEGIFVSSLRYNGTTLTEGTDYMISTAPGDTLPNGDAAGTLIYEFTGADGPLAFGENDQIQVCYAYSACFPNVDFFPVYTVVSTCDGEICTGPADVLNAGRLLSNFNFNAEFEARYEPVMTGTNNDGLPDICAPEPYVFDVVIGTTIDEPGEGDITNVRARINACASSFFALSMVEVINSDGTSAGALPENILSISSAANGNEPAGSLLINLRINDEVESDGLMDTDGDGNFDDIVGGSEVRLRFTFDVTCSMEDLGSLSPPREGGAPMCQFNEIFLEGRRRCDTQNRTDRLVLNNTPPFLTQSVSEFTNQDGTGITIPNPDEPGYQFGKIGNNQPPATGEPLTGAACTARPPSTREIVFQYTLGDNDFAACPSGGGDTRLTLLITGDERLTSDMEFSDIGFDSDNDGVADVFPTPADTTRTNVRPGELQFDIDLGDATAGQTFNFIFDVTMDTAFCSPRQIISVNAILTSTCMGGCNCAPVRTARSVRFEVDPDDCDCLCFMTSNVNGNRTTLGFTDNTRTTPVELEDISLQDQRRVLPGDTIELRTQFAVNTDAPQALVDQLNASNRLLQMEVIFAQKAGTNSRNYNNVDDFGAVLDHQLSRMTELTLFRPNTGETFDIGAAYSGTTQNLTATGLLIGGTQGSERVNGSAGTGELIQPAFPNGGYTFSSGDETRRDNEDGRRLAFQPRNFSETGGENNALETFFEAIDGGFQAGDTINMTWQVVLLENPGFVGPEIDLEFTSVFTASSFIGAPTDGAGDISLSPTICENNPIMFQYHNPQVALSPRVVYEDGCDGEVVYSFIAGNQLPVGWYPNEFRPVLGVEALDVQIPFPYYYTGEGTVETSGIPAIALEQPDSTMNVDSATVAGTQVFRPTEGSNFGTLTFIDAELRNGVRSRGHANIDFGEDDITTVGGSFPLLTVGGDRMDTLIFRFPIRRVCGDQPMGTPTATYDWANRHLGDYETLPYVFNDNSRGGLTNYWVGKVRDNDGNIVMPVNRTLPTPTASQTFYFPFVRLPLDEDDAINPHRDLGNMSNYSIFGLPPVLAASASVSPAGNFMNSQTDGTKAVTISPNSDTEFGGTVLITVGEGANITSITNAGAPIDLIPVTITDTASVFAFTVPAGSGTGTPFSFDLTTELLFCEAATICITPLVGCTDDPAAAAEAAAGFGVSCGGQTCYSYEAGSAAVETTFGDPVEQDLCTTQSYFVQYRNTGTANLSDFSPVLFIPEGLDVSNFMYSINGTTAPLTAPTYDGTNPSANMVFGEGGQFTQAEIDVAVGLDGTPGFGPGEILTIMFDGRTSCEFTSGLPLVSAVMANDPCGNVFEGDEAFSSNINVALPPEANTTFSFSVDDTPLEVSCSENGDRLVFTAANVGKASAEAAEICVRLPDGISLDLDNINALAPAGFTVDPADIETTPINEGGDVQVCFPSPELPTGSFVCLEVPFIIGDIECGPVFIGATVITRVDVACGMPGPGDTNPCEIGVSNTEMQFLEINVVPAVNAGDAELTAVCTSTPGVFDVDFNFNFVAESQPYNGEVVLSLYSDVNADGMYDPDVDTQIGTDQMIQVALAQDESEMFRGTFQGVDQSEICPLLLGIESLGCTCSESFLPFPNVLPDFVADLGESVVLCPGEPFTFEGICADLNYAFANPAAGSVLVNDATGEATIMLNDGFGVEGPEQLLVTGNFGTCGLETSIDVSSPGMIGFGPYEYQVCNVGRQEVDLNIPLALQEDITVEILNPVSINNPNSVEPIIEDLQETTTYDVIFSFNDGSCQEMTTLTAVVNEAIEVTVMDITGCSTGFDLTDRVTVTPNFPGKFQTDGDGRFEPDNDLFDDDGNQLEVRYIPGPMEIEQGFVGLRYNSDAPEGPCGPTTERFIATIQLVDCGNFFWDGSDD